MVIVADREYGVNVTPLIDMLPLFAKNSGLQYGNVVNFMGKILMVGKSHHLCK